MNIDKVLSPHPKEDFDVGSRVAIVGNSGLILDSELGEEINEHDTIFRFNAAPTEGFDEDVGSRTDVRILNAITQKGSTCNGTDQVGLDYLRDLFHGDRIICKRTTDEVFGQAKENYEDVAVWISKIDGRAYYLTRRKIREMMGDTRKRATHLSLGVLWSLVMTECANEVNLYGFGFHQESLENIHYWEDVDKDITAHHDYEFEKEVVDEFENSGLLSRIHHEKV